MANSNDRLEQRLRDAGPREAVPQERADRVRRMVGQEWRARVADIRRRRRNRQLMGFAAAAVLVLAVAVSWLGGGGVGTSASISVGQIAAARGSVWVRSGVQGDASARTETALNETLQTGVELTTAPDAQVAVQMVAGGTFRLAGGSTVRLQDARSFVLEQGAIYVDSKTVEGSETGTVEIVTPYGTTRNIGTQFEVRLDADILRILVREGQVALRNDDGTIDIGAEEQIKIGPDNLVVRGRISSIASDWEWLARAVPMMDIEGESLAKFLRWYARERGFRLKIESAADTADPASIELNGSVSGMTMEQALESVLLTAQWDYRIDDDVLTVRPAL